MPSHIVQVNRAPVLTLWATVVAERLGYDPATALTLGKALAGLNAQSKGRRLGIFHAAPGGEHAAPGEEAERAGAAKAPAAPAAGVVQLMGREIAVIQTPQGLRAAAKGLPVDPAAVDRYLSSKFGPSLPEVRAVMERLARSRSPHDLSVQAYALYEAFRPSIPAGAGGWGAAGDLNLGRIAEMADAAPGR